MVGSICNCILPEALKISAVQHDPNNQPYDSEKRSLRSAFSCLSSISMRQKQLSSSSLFLQSPLKGCLPPWELRRSNNGSLKERWDSLWRNAFAPMDVSNVMTDLHNLMRPWRGFVANFLCINSLKAAITQIISVLSQVCGVMFMNVVTIVCS